jgi:Glycoside hydrolase family 44
MGFDITGYFDWKEPRQWEMNPSSRRLGGNQSSRYNWGHGTAFNHGLDWVFANNGMAEGAEPYYVSFLKQNVEHNVVSVVQVPMLGWVAKDITSVSFPTTKFTGQKDRDDKRAAGKGVMISGREIEPPPPQTTSIPITPAIVAGWIEKYRAADTKNTTRIYILDNEPALWNSTHRDVHPEPMSYDELLEKTIAYATVIRKADPKALIAGPASFGWAEYLYSARDIKAGVMKRPDKDSHGGLNMLPYYLKTLADHEKKTGDRLLDLVDVHFYPQGDKIGIAEKGAVDPDTAGTRIRSARALWDDSYEDESWIKEKIRLIPRLKEWIAQYYPGRGIQIGEWNFGAEGHISGGLATAEALGRFAEGGVTSAFYWAYPKPGSPAYFGFRAFRNFDGRGGKFQDNFVASAAQEGVSMFVSRDDGGKHLVAVAINGDTKAIGKVAIDLGSCGELQSATEYEYAGGPDGFKPAPLTAPELAMKPRSIKVLDILLK